MEKRIGQVTHFYTQLGVAVLALDEGLKIGEIIHIAGHTTDLIQRVESMEVDHHQVEAVGPGADVALAVSARVRPGDAIYKVEERAGILVGFEVEPV